MSSDHHFELAVRISIEALKALVLVTGGAAAAMVTWLAHGALSNCISWSAGLFGGSALMAAITLAAGYWAQLAYANYVLAREGNDHLGAEERHVSHERRMLVAWGCFALAILTALGGLILAIMGAAR